MHISWISRPWPYRAMPRDRTAHRRRWAATAAATAITLLTLTAACAPGAAASGTAKAVTPAKPGAVSCGPPGYFIQCYSPGQYRVAYGVAPLLKRGITGKGETVVMPELADAPGPNFTDIRKDLAAFDRRFGLPAAKLKLTTTLAGASAPYVAGTEEVEDTEIVHTIAPAATLDVVLVAANATASAANFTAAVTGTIHAAVARHAAVVSISGSHGERLFTPAEVARIHAALLQAAARHITVVASSGDTGVISDERPACAGQPARLGPAGAGCGRHRLERQHLHWRLPRRDGLERRHQRLRRWLQLFVPPAVLPGRHPTHRPNAGRPRRRRRRGLLHCHVADVHRRRPLPSPGHQRRHPAVGRRDRTGRPGRRPQLGFVDQAIYAIARSPSYHRAFHDVITGDNSVFWPTRLFTGYQAGPGWDPVTGWGSPNAQILVPLLAHYGRPGGTAHS